MNFEVDNGLTLRLLQIEDAENLFALVDANRAYLKEWLPWLDRNADVKDSISFITSIHEQFHAGFGFACGVFLSGRLVGMCGFHPINPSDKSVVIGYWLSEDVQGSGIISRCTKFLIGYAFCELKLDKVYIPVAVENSKSRAVCERIGLVSEGVVPKAEFLYDKYVDHVRYAISKGEWLARPK